MTGIHPATLLNDEQLYAAAIEQAEHAEWSGLHELLATQIELTHHMLLQLKASAGADRSELEEPLRWPRPKWFRDATKPQPLSGLEAARAIQGMGGG